MKKLIIEVAINETIMRSQNRHVPLTAEEIAEDAYQCFLEGATIIHFHNRTPDYPDDGTYDSARNGDHEAYAETMRLIAAKWIQWGAPGLIAVIMLVAPLMMLLAKSPHVMIIEVFMGMMIRGMVMALVFALIMNFVDRKSVV